MPLASAFRSRVGCSADDLPARAGCEAAAVGLDAADPGPPVGRWCGSARNFQTSSRGGEQLAPWPRASHYPRPSRSETEAEQLDQVPERRGGERRRRRSRRTAARDEDDERPRRRPRAADEPRHAFRVDEDLPHLQPRHERRRHPVAVALEELDQVEVRADGDDQLGALLVSEQQRDVLADAGRRDDRDTEARAAASRSRAGRASPPR